MKKCIYGTTHVRNSESNVDLLATSKQSLYVGGKKFDFPNISYGEKGGKIEKFRGLEGGKIKHHVSKLVLQVWYSQQYKKKAKKENKDKYYKRRVKTKTSNWTCVGADS